LFGDADLFTGRVMRVSVELEARRVDGLLCNADLFSLCRTEAWRVNGGLVDSNLFTIAWLEARSVFTLAHVNLSLVVVTTVMRYLDRDVSVVVSAVVWELDVDMCTGVFVVRSAIFTDVDVFSAARTVVTILFASDVDFLLAESVAASRKIGRERGVLFLPSDALLSGW